MPPPSILIRVRHAIGRAIRETGQALDRVGIRGNVHAHSKTKFGDDPYKFQDHLSRHRNLMPLLKRGKPKIDDNVAFIAPCSSLIGTVHVGSGSSIWYKAILRADRANMGLGHSEDTQEKWKGMNKFKREEVDPDSDNSAGGGGIFIGKNSNIQDGCIITSNEDHTMIGDGVTIGHMASINSSTIESNCLIGMGSTLNPGSRVESLSFVAAGAVVGRDVTVKSGELWVGNPAKKLRDLTQEEKEKLFYQANEYVKIASTQSNIMELGGNVSDSIVENLLDQSIEQEENENTSKSQ